MNSFPPFRCQLRPDDAHDEQQVRPRRSGLINRVAAAIIAGRNDLFVIPYGVGPFNGLLPH